jgi:hypothetical protein
VKLLGTVAAACVTASPRRAARIGPAGEVADRPCAGPILRPLEAFGWTIE